MRKKIPLLLLILFCNVYVHAQDTTFLPQFNQKRLDITRNSMLVLGSWATLNIASGAVGNFTAGGEARYVHQMNAIWNLVNLGIAIPGYLGARKQHARPMNWQKSLSEQQKAEKIYLVNGALDLAYITGGLALRAYGNTRSPGKQQDRWKGYGTSLLIQGGFLLLFDGVNYTLHLRHGKSLFRKFDGMQVGVLPGGFSLVCGI